jgi:hypothetical protein
MVSHVVLMKLRPDLTPTDRRALVGAFERAIREIATVRHVRFGRRVVHGAGYEHAAPDGADFLIIIDFDNLAGLHAYLTHPAHAELGARFRESLASALVYDYEIGGLESLKNLV